MPIRFRCAYCNQLMTIASRKSGTVVPCPTCAGQVVVPPPVPDASPTKSGSSAFDQPDFEQKLQAPARQPNLEMVPVRVTAEPEPAGLFLSSAMLTVSGIVMLLLLGLAFFAGMIAGKGQ